MGQRPGNSRSQAPLDPQTSSRELFKVLAVCCFLVLMVLLVFGQASHFEFIVCDDDPYVYGNSHVIEGFHACAWKSRSDNPLWWSLTTCTAGNWHPLTWMSHVIDGQLWGIHGVHFFGGKPVFSGEGEAWKGPEAGEHHLTSVLLHAAAAVFLFLALRRLTAAFWCSALVAAIFAIHPLRAESVAWVAERKDVLSGLFWMLTLWAYGNYALRPSVGRYLGLVGVFAVGLTAKSMLVTLPCVLLLLDFWPLRRWQPKQLAAGPTEQPSRCVPQSFGWLVLEKLPLFALSAFVSTIVAVGQRSMGCMSMTDNVAFPYRIANAAFSGADYLWKLICPTHLAIFYTHLAIMGDAAKARLVWYGIAGGLVLAAITVFVLWNLRRRPYLAVGWFWYLGTLVPVIGLIQVGAQGMADRYTYLPMIGVTIMLVWGGAEVAARFPQFRVGMSVAAGLVLASWAAIAFAQVSTWETSETVFQHAVDVTSENYFAYNHLGLAYQYAHFPGHMEKAGEQFKLAVQYGPSYDASNANLGVYYMNLKEPEKALQYFKRAVDVNSYAAFHHANLAGVYFTLKRFDDAGVQLREALRIEPTSVRYHQSLALVLLRQQKTAKALAELDEILRLAPNDAATMKDIAWLLATNPDASIRDGRRALSLAQQANELAHESDPFILVALAAAYAETGRSEEAVETAGEAAKIAAMQNNPSLVEFARRLVAVFASGSPFREVAPPPPTGHAPSR